MGLPHVVPFVKSPLYFFTACAADRQSILANQESNDILREIWTRSADLDGWWVGRYLIMPDHVHFFAMPAADAKTRSGWMKTWKSISARRINKAMGAEPSIWQADTFDHILRSAESYPNRPSNLDFSARRHGDKRRPYSPKAMGDWYYAEKWNYVRENPVRGGLVARSEDWRWQGEIHRLAF